ncbi:unnamed protein product, partial [Dovyalis caffra]
DTLVVLAVPSKLAVGKYKETIAHSAFDSILKPSPPPASFWRSRFSCTPSQATAAKVSSTP